MDYSFDNKEKFIDFVTENVVPISKKSLLMIEDFIVKSNLSKSEGIYFSECVISFMGAAFIKTMSKFLSKPELECFAHLFNHMEETKKCLTEASL